jgi:hypothetical protein
VFFAEADARVAMHAEFFVEQYNALLVARQSVCGAHYHAVAALVAQYCAAFTIVQHSNMQRGPSRVFALEHL